jgi:all-trans-retinol 13,14-reductase
MTVRTPRYTVRTGTRFRPQLAAEHYDVIVVGSGLGGLCTAALLAKFGKRVCVLEQHYTAGGYTHSYERAGYEWDVGVHYVGEVHKPHAVLRRVFDVISDGVLQWAPMDPVYDRIVLGERVYDFRAGRGEFKAELIKHFPDEAEAIERYVELIGQISSQTPKFFAGQAMPRTLGNLYAKTRKWMLPAACFKTTREVLESLTTNQELIGVLTGQWGDYGLPPGQSSFLMHAMLAKHYLAGGNYPVGGASAIARSIIPVIEAAGGKVFTYAGVEQILVGEKGAYGVRLKKGGHELHADKIVSCAGIFPTYQRLLTSEVQERYGLASAVRKVEVSSSHVCLYLGFTGSAESLGLPKTNYWLYPDADHDASLSRFKASGGLDFPLIYISFPAAKDPLWNERYPDRTTVEIVAPTLPQWFEQWQGTTWGKRGEDYEAFKEKITEALLASLYRFFPQLKQALDYAELSTPLSTEWFQWNMAGEIYGIDHTVARFNETTIHSQTPVPRLYLTGADTVTAGVGGALMSGVLTASCLMGRRAGEVQQLLKNWQPPTNPKTVPKPD